MENLHWLLDNGGPAIKLNLMNEGLIEKNVYDAEELVNELMKIEKVKTVLTYFDRFKDFKSMPLNTLYANIHNCYEYCFEMFMPFLIRLGFKSGMPVLDEKIEIMCQVYRYLSSLRQGYWEQIVMLLMEAGYYYEDMLELMANKFLDKSYATAKGKYFDIYETDPSKIRWSKLPDIWKDKPITKEMHVHDFEASEFPLPTIYHIRYMIEIYKYVEEKSIKDKIDTVIKYILHPEYQKLRGDYGYGWFFNKSYYASSPGVSLPFYEDKIFDGGYKNNLEMMSHIPLASHTEWFRNSINFLEQYKTKQGTYMLPENCFYNVFVRPANSTVVYSAFISKDVKMKAGDKRSFAIELLSTFYVLLLKYRMEN